MKAKLVIYRTRSLRRSQRWAWRLVASNGRIIATSGEGYVSRNNALHMGMRVTNGDHRYPEVVMPS